MNENSRKVLDFNKPLKRNNNQNNQNSCTFLAPSGAQEMRNANVRSSVCLSDESLSRVHNLRSV